jgi:transcriptional regulator
MYTPKQFAETDPKVLHALIESQPLGAWVTLTEEGLVANHVPFFLDTTRGEHGTLVGHVARANPVWKTLSTTVPSIVIYQGAQSYITPSWYPSKHEHHKAVPTWAYAVVHAHGVPQVRDDATWLHAHVSQLTNRHEAKRAEPWHVSDAPTDYVDTMLKAIVGIEIPITKLQGKWKLNQHRPAPDKEGTMAGLSECPDTASREMADLMKRYLADH